MKYLAEVHIKNQYTGKFDQGTYVKSSDSLDEIRDWAKGVGKSGDELFIVKNGDKISSGRTLTL